MINNLTVILDLFVEQHSEELGIRINKWIEEDTRPHKAALFELVGTVINDFSSHPQIGKKMSRFLSKLLLVYPKGFKLIDGLMDQDICNILLREIHNHLIKFEYKDLTRDSYLHIVETEEILHLLGILISHSSRLKAEFVRSGTFDLYLKRFGSALKYYQPQIQELRSTAKVSAGKNVVSQTPSLAATTTGFVKADKVTANDPKLKNRQAENERRLQPSKKLEGKDLRATKTERYSTVSCMTTTNTLMNNVREAIVNLSGHIQSYMIVLKSLFINPHIKAIELGTENFLSVYERTKTIINFLIFKTKSTSQLSLAYLKSQKLSG